MNELKLHSMPAFFRMFPLEKYNSSGMKPLWKNIGMKIIINID